MQAILDDGIWKVQSARGNFASFIHQFQPETKKIIRKL